MTVRLLGAFLGMPPGAGLESSNAANGGGEGNWN
jgi:hypothetical protein